MKGDVCNILDREFALTELQRAPTTALSLVLEGTQDTIIGLVNSRYRERGRTIEDAAGKFFTNEAKVGVVVKRGGILVGRECERLAHQPALANV